MYRFMSFFLSGKKLTPNISEEINNAWTKLLPTHIYILMMESLIKYRDNFVLRLTDPAHFCCFSSPITSCLLYVDLTPSYNDMVT
jgi:hypothetical protein